MNYVNLLKLQQIAAKRIQKADFETGKELLDLLSDFIMESNEAPLDDMSELYIDCKDYYEYAKVSMTIGLQPKYLLSLEEFLFLNEEGEFDE